MKILIYGLNYAPEVVGIAKYTTELSEWLSKRDNMITVISSVPYYPHWNVKKNRYQRYSYENLKIYKCPIWVPLRLNGIKRILHLLSFSLTSFPILLRQVILKPDVIMVIAPSILCTPSVIILKRLVHPKTKIWLHIQDFEIDAAFNLNLLKGQIIRSLSEKIEQIIYTNFDQISTISNSMIKKLLMKGIEEKKIFYLPNWYQKVKDINLKKISKNQYLRDLNIPLDSKIILYSGSINEKQGIETLVEVFKYLDNISNLIMIIAGDGISKDKLVRMSKKYKKIVHLPLQPIDKLKDFLELADVHLLPQKMDVEDLMLPSKLLGIMASGKPVVSNASLNSELGSLVEKVGIRVDPNDNKKFAEAIKILLNNPDLNQKKGKKGLEIVKNFEIDRVLKNFLNQLQKLLN